jgi:hypothetical protein
MTLGTSSKGLAENSNAPGMQGYLFFHEFNKTADARAEMLPFRVNYIERLSDRRLECLKKRY